MPFYVYILACYIRGKFSCYYVGQTNNLYARTGEHFDNVEEHHTESFTGRFEFVKRIWYKQVPTRVDALRLEKYLKSLTPDRKRAYMRNN